MLGRTINANVIAYQNIGLLFSRIQICDHDVRVDTGPKSSPDQWSGHTVTPPIREILVPRHWPAAPTSRGRVTIDINGSNIGGPIVEHNGDISFDLQHKDCVCGICGMAYYEEKGTQCKAINGYSLLSRIQSGLSVCVQSGPGREQKLNSCMMRTVTISSSCQLASAQWAPPEKLQKMREMRINWWYGGDGHWRSSFLNKPTTGSSEINL